MRTGFDILTDVVLEHCCHCYDNLGLRMCFWTKDTRSCSSHGQSDYLRSSFSTKKEYSNLSSKIQKADCNTNSAMVFNLGSLRPVTRTLLVSCTSPGVNLWRYESFQDLWENHCFFYGLARRYRQLFWEDSASITLTVHDGWLEEIVNFHSSRANPKIVDNSSQCSGSWQRRSLQRVSLPSILVC